MIWNQALKQLKEQIQLDLHLTPKAQFKIVREIPPFKCENYNNIEGFRVQVGTKSFVNIPLDMLKVIFLASVKNNNIYNRAVFKGYFPRELNAKPCNIHSVGKLFEHAGVMQMLDKYTYEVLS